VNTRGALTSYGAERVGTAVGLKLSGEAPLRLEDQPNPFRWGDESSSSLLLFGKERVGNVFTARKGKRVFHVLFVGPPPRIRRGAG